jgi:hypothetical protein
MKPAARETHASAGPGSNAARAVMAVARPSTSIVTRMKFATSSERMWDGLMFYEQIAERPPLHLRLLLPQPIGTENPKSTVGDKVRCLYKGGHLLKCITQIDLRRHYAFDVVEQSVAFGGTEVAVTTRYTSLRRPGWLWKPIEAAVCHLFHRHLLSAMRRKVGSR